MNAWIKGIGAGIAILMVGAILGGPEHFGLFALAVPGFVFCMMLIAVCWFPESLVQRHEHMHQHTHRLEQPQQVARPNMISMTNDEYHELIDRAVGLGTWIKDRDAEHQQKQRWQVVDRPRIEHRTK